MRMTHFLISLFFTAFVYANVALAADATQPADTKEAKLETISGTVTSDSIENDNCPMHKGNKNYKDHHGEPCPYHGKEHPHKAHEKCEHDQRKE